MVVVCSSSVEPTPLPPLPLPSTWIGAALGVVIERVVEQQQAGGAVGGGGDQDLAVVDEIGGIDVLDGVGADGGLEQAVIGEAAGVMAVDGGGLQLERGADAVAEAAAVDQDTAAGVGERVVEQQQAGGVVGGGGDQDLAVVDEIGPGEVLDGVVVPDGGLEQAVDVELLPAVAAVDGGGLQLERGAERRCRGGPSTWIVPPAAA